MADIYDTNTVNKEQNWFQKNSDWLTPIATSVADIGYKIYANKQDNKFNAQQAEIQRQFNAAEAEKARQYETEMSNTAYQRAYADMKAAGLNPNLAGGSGGASTPAGSMASGNAATTTGMMPMNFSENLGTALTQAQIANMNANTQKTYKETGKTETEIKTMEIDNEIKQMKAPIEMMLMNANTEKEKAQAKNIRKQLDIYEKQMAEIDEHIALLRSQGKYTEAKAETEKRLQKGIQTRAWINSISGAIGNVSGAAGHVANEMTNDIMMPITF